MVCKCFLLNSYLGRKSNLQIRFKTFYNFPINLDFYQSREIKIIIIARYSKKELLLKLQVNKTIKKSNFLTTLNNVCAYSGSHRDDYGHSKD